MTITALAIKRPTLVVVLFSILTILGFFSYSQLTYELLPKITPPVVTVATVYTGASPSEVETMVTKHLEEAVSGIDKVDADLSSTAADNGSGAISNVNVYVIDTGVDKSHLDLNVVNHVNFAGGKNADCNGHGTHVAGTVAAMDNDRDVVGVAPGTPITGVTVLG